MYAYAAENPQNTWYTGEKLIKQRAAADVPSIRETAYPADGSEHFNMSRTGSEQLKMSL